MQRRRDSPKIETVGDLLNGIEERGLLKVGKVKVRNHSGCTTNDLTRHIKAYINREEDKNSVS